MTLLFPERNIHYIIDFTTRDIYHGLYYPWTFHTTVLRRYWMFIANRQGNLYRLRPDRGL